METKFNFNSQICTTTEQSERLLALGLKKETADMYYEMKAEEELPRLMPHASEIDYFQLWDSITPAWSLHRLVSLCKTDNIRIAFNEKDCWGGNIQRISLRKYFEKDNLYDNLCDCIEWLIKEGYFNKEYLNEDI